MKRIVVTGVALAFVLAIVSPAAAQLIDWNRREKKGGTTAPAPRATRRYAPAPKVIEVRGTIIDLDQRANRVTIRDSADGRRKAFIVDADVMPRLSRYDEIILKINEGSSVAQSVEVVTY